MSGQGRDREGRGEKNPCRSRSGRFKGGFVRARAPFSRLMRTGGLLVFLMIIPGAAGIRPARAAYLS